MGGQNISQGWSADIFDTVDPYIAVSIPEINGVKETRHFANDVNPKWEEKLKFWLPKAKENEEYNYSLLVKLMDANLVFANQLIDSQSISLKDTPLNEEIS